MKRFLSVLIFVITLISLSACNSSDNTTITVDPTETIGPTIPTIPFDLPQYTPSNGEVDIVIEGTFAFEDVKSLYAEGEPGVWYDGFVNTEKSECKTPEDAIELAKKETRITYDIIHVSYDENEKIYCVTFATKGLVGGCDSVYLSEDGITLLTVAGE